MIKNKLENIQILRAIAAILVVFHHVLLTLERYYPTKPSFANIGSIRSFGESGVDIFFCISGFIITSKMWEEFNKKQFQYKFLIERIIRVAPMYWLLTIIVIIIHQIKPELVSSEISTRSIINSLFFVPTTEMPILKVGWSLNYEVFFYFIFAILLAFRRNAAAIIGAMFFATLQIISAMAPSLIENWPPLTFASSTLLYEFLFGSIVAAIFKSNPNLLTKHSNTLLLIGFFALFASITITINHDYRVIF